MSTKQVGSFYIAAIDGSTLINLPFLIQKETEKMNQQLSQVGEFNSTGVKSIILYITLLIT